MELSAAERTAVSDITRICSEEDDSRALRRRVATRLSRLMYSDASCWAVVDPWTLLLTDEFTINIPAHVGPVTAHNEYLVADINKLTTLARSATRVGILSQAQNELQRTSRRLLTVLPILNARYEIRAACVADGQCWGAIGLFRAGEHPDFSTAEANLLSAVTIPLAAGLRRTAYRPGSGMGITAHEAGPGVLILGPRNETLLSNDAARQWLDELSPAHGGRHRELPHAVHQVAARVHAGAENPPHAYSRVRSRSGRWLTVHGSPITNDLAAAGGVAVTLNAAPTSDIAELLMLAYGLTLRERQVLQRVIAGTASVGIAAQLQISGNTVQDHLKAIFAKVGVRSRGQLVAQVIGQPYLPDTIPR